MVMLRIGVIVGSSDTGRQTDELLSCTSAHYQRYTPLLIILVLLHFYQQAKCARLQRGCDMTCGVPAALRTHSPANDRPVRHLFEH